MTNKKMVLRVLFFFLMAFSNILYSQLEYKNWGFIRVTEVGSLGPLVSYTNRNMTAPTAADFNFERISTDSGRISTQLGQSRFGSSLLLNSQVSGTFEFDFIDFTKSSPTLQTLPRVRLLHIVYQPNTNWKFILGQDWDLFLPLNPFDYNFIGSMFTSGNVGFMRDQAKMAYLGVKDVELLVALGMPGNNPSTADTNLELASLPSVAFQGTLKSDKMGKFLLALMASRLIEGEVYTKSYNAYGLGLSWDQQIGDTKIRAEGHFSQNLAMMGSLTMDRRTSLGDNQELGAWVSVKQALLSDFNVTFNAGKAHIMKSDNVLAYTGPGTGMTDNFNLKLGLEYVAQPGLSFLVQCTRVATEYQTKGLVIPTGGKFLPTPSNLSTQATTFLELGALYQF